MRWWAEHKMSYQILSSVALCVPATSVTSEHVFFKAGDVITCKKYAADVLPLPISRR